VKNSFHTLKERGFDMTEPWAIIIAAVIGVIGTVAAGLAGRKPSTQPTQTQTALAGDQAQIHQVQNLTHNTYIQQNQVVQRSRSDSDENGFLPLLIVASLAGPVLVTLLTARYWTTLSIVIPIILLLGTLVSGAVLPWKTEPRSQLVAYLALSTLAAFVAWRAMIRLDISTLDTPPISSLALGSVSEVISAVGIRGITVLLYKWLAVLCGLSAWFFVKLAVLGLILKRRNPAQGTIRAWFADRFSVPVGVLCVVVILLAILTFALEPLLFLNLRAS
jgi:membrane protein